MIPLRDVQRTRSTPLLVIALICANVVVYLYQLSLGHNGVEHLFHHYALIPAKFWDLGTYSREGILAAFMPLVTSMFLHGGLAHLGMNMWFLWIFGDNIEDRLGKARFLALYLITGIAAGLTHAVFSPQSPLPTVGASGAISGILGAYLVMFPGAWILTWLFPFFLVPLPALIFLGVWFMGQLFPGIASLVMPQTIGGPAWFAHIGGFLSGMFLVKVFDKRSPRRRPRSQVGEEDY